MLVSGSNQWQAVDYRSDVVATCLHTLHEQTISHFKAKLEPFTKEVHYTTPQVINE